MARICLLLAFLLMGSALSLVTARFQSRQLFVSLDRMEDRARDLDTDWRRLQLERAENARQARIDQLARQELKLIARTPDRVLYIKPQASHAAGEGGRP